MIEIDIGKRFGNLVALERDTQKGKYWKCKCDCGKIKSILVYDIVGGRTKSCGCTTFSQRRKTRFDKLISKISEKKFGRLTVLGFDSIKKGKSYWKCKCDCGNEIVVGIGNVKNGTLRSCGCLRTHKYKPGEAGLRKIFLSYRKSARKEGHEFKLTIEEFKEITSKSCVYCGIEPLRISASERTIKDEIKEYTAYRYNGIDRIDSSKGYEKGNVNPCCRWCNFIKRERTVEELKEHVNRIYRYDGNVYASSNTRQKIKTIVPCRYVYKYAPGESGLRYSYSVYKSRAKKYKRTFKLTLEEFKDITLKNCFYCGLEPTNVSLTKASNDDRLTEYKSYTYNGIDRIDSSKGYEKGNVAPCCKWCNIAKGNKSVEEFKEHIFKMHEILNNQKGKDKCLLLKLKFMRLLLIRIKWTPRMKNMIFQ